MVQAQVGQSFAELTRIGLARAKGMVAFCTSDYGAYTGAGYETFHELEYAHDNKLQIFPIRLCEEWPPAPQDNPRGTFQNEFVFKNGLVYVDDRQMNNAEGAADQIADSVTSPGGIFWFKLGEGQQIAKMLRKWKLASAAFRLPMVRSAPAWLNLDEFEEATSNK